MSFEFKIKNGIIIDDTAPVNGIVNDVTVSSSSNTNLATENAIVKYTTTQINNLDIRRL